MNGRRMLGRDDCLDGDFDGGEVDRNNLSISSSSSGVVFNEVVAAAVVIDHFFVMAAYPPQEK